MNQTDVKLLLTITERDQGERLVAVAKQAGAPGGTILQGRGTAGGRILQLLGLGDTRKDITLILLPAGLLPPVRDALTSDPWIRHKVRGMGMVLDVSLLIRHAASLSSPPNQGASMTASAHELISVIVNAGYADDIMAAARQAGATGGTIVNACGTGREEDIKFFGITIVPEKELLMILTEKEKAPAILNAIRALPCLTEPGMGIAFCMNVEQFITLGPNQAGR